MDIKPVRLAAATVAVALTTLLLAGCTASLPTSSSPASPSRGATASIRPDANVPTDVPNTPALRADVQVTACKAAGNGWMASGTAKNPGDADRSYTITIFFTSDKATVLGTGDTSVKVPAGKSTKWEVRADLTPAHGMRCVLRGVGK
ncbi:hypothetical protein [Leifsonia xyli]|uniref:hypothetical protein n=1 Tax=Leifsonia xyli TaxID=1575 RepID=UPI003D67D2D7